MCATTPSVCSTGDHTQDLMCVTQALYQLNESERKMIISHRRLPKKYSSKQGSKKKPYIIFSLEEEGGALKSSCLLAGTLHRLCFMNSLPLVTYSSLNTMPKAVGAHLVDAL